MKINNDDDNNEIEIDNSYEKVSYRQYINKKYKEKLEKSTY